MTLLEAIDAGLSAILCPECGRHHPGPDTATVPRHSVPGTDRVTCRGSGYRWEVTPKVPAITSTDTPRPNPAPPRRGASET